VGSTDKEPSNKITFSAFGWAAFAASAPFSLRLAYEQTLLTRNDGPQMVGFAMAHVFPFLLLLGVAGFICSCIWLLIFIRQVLTKWTKNQPPLPRMIWTQGCAIAMALVVQMIPYCVWMAATVMVAGPGQHGPALLVYAAADGDTFLANLLLDRGVPVNPAGEDQATALNGACETHKIEVARMLIARGADANMAKDCWEIPEFRAKMKPIVPGADPTAKFPRGADTTIYVNGNGPPTSTTGAASPAQ